MKNILFPNHSKEVQKRVLVEICMQFLLQVNMQTDQEEILHLEILEYVLNRILMENFIKMEN
jgi:hypothetical protein